MSLRAPGGGGRRHHRANRAPRDARPAARGCGDEQLHDRHDRGRRGVRIPAARRRRSVDRRAGRPGRGRRLVVGGAAGRSDQCRVALSIFVAVLAYTALQMAMRGSGRAMIADDLRLRRWISRTLTARHAVGRNRRRRRRPARRRQRPGDRRRSGKRGRARRDPLAEARQHRPHSACCSWHSPPWPSSPSRHSPRQARPRVPVLAVALVVLGLLLGIAAAAIFAQPAGG